MILTLTFIYSLIVGFMIFFMSVVTPSVFKTLDEINSRNFLRFIFPRMFLTVYIVLLYKCTIWFMELPAPTFEQSGLISIVVGAGAAWFGLYAGTAKDKINSK